MAEEKVEDIDTGMMMVGVENLIERSASRGLGPDAMWCCVSYILDSSPLNQKPNEAVSYCRLAVPFKHVSDVGIRFPCSLAVTSRADTALGRVKLQYSL